MPANSRRAFPSEVKGWDIGDAGEDPVRWKHRGRHTRFAAGAAKQAVNDSGLVEGKYDPTRFGVYLGSGEGQQDFYSFTRMMSHALEGENLDVAAFTREGLETLHPMSELEQEPHMPASHMASMFNAQGPNANCLTACGRQQPGDW